MSEKMRDAFELWFWNYHHNDCSKDYWGVVFAVGSDGSYQGIACEAGWQAWQASRSALVVDLPSQLWAIDICEWVFDAESVLGSLSDSGVNHK